MAKRLELSESRSQFIDEWEDCLTNSLTFFNRKLYTRLKLDVGHQPLVSYIWFDNYPWTLIILKTCMITSI